MMRYNHVYQIKALANQSVRIGMMWFENLWSKKFDCDERDDLLACFKVLFLTANIMSSKFFKAIFISQVCVNGTVWMNQCMGQKYDDNNFF